MAQPGHRRLRSQHQFAQDQAALAQWNSNKWFVDSLLAHRLRQPKTGFDCDDHRIAGLVGGRVVTLEYIVRDWTRRRTRKGAIIVVEDRVLSEARDGWRDSLCSTEAAGRVHSAFRTSCSSRAELPTAPRSSHRPRQTR